MRHCDDYIDDVTQPLCLRRFLRFNRWPATYQFRADAMKVARPILFANWKGQKVRVVMASRFGDVGISRDLSKMHGYFARVAVDDLTDFASEPMTSALTRKG